MARTQEQPSARIAHNRLALDLRLMPNNGADLKPIGDGPALPVSVKTAPPLLAARLESGYQPAAAPPAPRLRPKKGAGSRTNSASSKAKSEETIHRTAVSVSPPTPSSDTDKRVATRRARSNTPPERRTREGSLHAFKEHAKKTGLDVAPSEFRDPAAQDAWDAWKECERQTLALASEDIDALRAESDRLRQEIQFLTSDIPAGGVRNAMTQDVLALILRRLAISLSNADPSSPLPSKAFEFLTENGLSESSLDFIRA